MLTGGLDLKNPEALKEFYIGNARRLSMAGKILFPVPNRRLSKRLYRLTAPTLLVWGKSDALIPPVYAEQFMVEAGYNGNDARQKLITLKWLLRGVTNALMDQAIHVDGMTREEAMHLMVEGGFQEEREAALKWTRAQLSFAQLSTYLVGYLEHVDLRAEAEKTWGEEFKLREYHDQLLSFGSPPVQFVRALLFDLPIAE